MSDSPSLADVQGHLDAFLVENQELETLTARLAAFNLFSVLRVENVEIRHSNVLAWLLSPDGSHGLGAVFLRRFLSRLLLGLETPNIKLTASQIELMTFADAEVLREWQNIDVLVRSPANRWCLLIENKVRSKESKGQLKKYMDRVKAEMPDYEIIPVYLTLEGDDPSDDGLEAGYMSLAYPQVLELAEQIVSQHRSRMPDDAHAFVNHYLATLRRLTMQDQQLIDLCKTIYRKHREAIDLIVEYGAVSNVHDAFIAEIESQVECEFIKSSGGAVWFLPAKMGALLPEQDMSKWGHLPRAVPVVFWYRYRKQGRLMLILEVGPIVDSAKRIALLETIRDAGIDVRDAGFRKEAKFTRISSVTQKVKLDEDGEPDLSDESIRQQVGAMWKKQSDAYEKVLKALDGFIWDD